MKLCLNLNHFGQRLKILKIESVNLNDVPLIKEFCEILLLQTKYLLNTDCKQIY